MSDLKVSFKVSADTGDTAKRIAEIERAIKGLGGTGTSIVDPTKNLRIGAGQTAGVVDTLISKMVGFKAAVLLAAGAAANFLMGSATAASQLESSFKNLQTLANNTGVSFKDAWAIVDATAANGMVTRKEATDQLRALISAGYTDLQQIKEMVETANKLALAFPKAGATPGQAVQEAFDGFRQGLSNKTDNFGMTDNLDDIYKKYARTINKTADSLNQLEKNQAFANAVIEFGKQNLAGATEKANKYEQATAKLGQAWGDFKVRIGDGVAPLLTSIANAMTGLVGHMSGLGNMLGVAAEGFRLLVAGGKTFLGLFSGDSWAKVNLKIGQMAESVAWGTSRILSGTVVGNLLGIPEGLKGENAGPTAGTSVQSTPNTSAIAANRKKQQDMIDESDAKAYAKKLEQVKATASAVDNAELDELKAGNDRKAAVIAKNLEARKITAVEAARETGRLQTEVLVKTEQNLAAESERIKKARAGNTKGDGSAFDSDMAEKLTAEEAALQGRRLAAMQDTKKAQIDTQREMSAAQKQMAQEAAGVLATTFQAQLDTEQTAFEAALSLKKADLDNALEARLISQREYFDKEKALGLASVDEEERQNRAKLANALKLQAMATNPQERASAAAEVAKLNAQIAASTTKRATAEVEALTKGLALEEQIKSARAGLVQKGLEIKGDLLGGELAAIDENLRQFERQFAGQGELIAQRQAIANDERQMAQFNDQKRRLDDKVNAESLAEQRISRLVQNGQMTQIEGDRAMLKARLEAGAAIEENAVALEGLAKMYPDNAQLQSVAASAREAADALKGSLDTLATGFNRDIADTIGERIEGWTNGIHSFGDAVRGVFADVFGNVAKKFLKAFTDDLFVALNSSGGQGAGGFLSGLFKSGGGSAGASGGGGFLSGIASMFGFADGGYTGRGGKYEPAGVVHRDEFVFNREAVAAIGLPALYAAMHNKRLPQLFTGGSPGQSMPSLASLPSANVNNDIHIAPNLFFDLDDLANKLGRRPQFERDIVRVSIANQGKIGR